MPNNPIVLPALLANPFLLKRLEGSAPHAEINAEEIEKLIFLEYHRSHTEQPDHIFWQRWEYFKQKHRPEQEIDSYYWATPALIALSERFLYQRQQQVKITLSKFGDWQNLLCRLSGLPIFAAFLAKKCSSELTRYELSDYIKNILGKSILLTPHDAIIEDYIQREGLHETHLHLNGTTFAELCWQNALKEPEVEYKIFKDSYGLRVRELYATVDAELNPETLYHRLCLAKQIRIHLISYAFDNASSFDQLPLCQLADLEKSSGHLPEELDSFFHQSESAHCLEVVWLVKILQKSIQENLPLIDKLLHLYLLLKNQYLQLLVQRDDTYGFDQFQKITCTELRSNSEKDYLSRFFQLHGQESHNPSRIGWLEGRFAPKTNVEENNKLLRNILLGYWRYLNLRNNYSDLKLADLKLTDLKLTDLKLTDLKLADLKLADLKLTELLEQLTLPAPNSGKLRLALVAHFIKKSWDYRQERSYRFSNLRTALLNAACALEQALGQQPKLRTWIRGVDAAANELHTPPEVFAPIFRYCQRIGLEHRTYHVGEDFYHLIGGMRQIVDAIELLDLQPGNRLGHATAIGIHPDHWLNSVPTKLVVKRGDWLLDLLMAWRLLSQRNDCYAQTNRLRQEISKLSSIIFNQSVSCETLEDVFKLRHLWPDYVIAAVQEPNWCWRTASVNDHLREEARLVHEVLESGQRSALQCLELWLCDPQLWKRSEELIYTDANFLDQATLTLLQQQVLQLVAKRRLIIETLPTSNVRISQYRHIKQHHVFRWMQIPGYIVEGDPEIMLSLGSDDPGIFATDVYSEFYHLYAVLREDCQLSDYQALQYLAKLNERGRIYRFHE